MPAIYFGRYIGKLALHLVVVILFYFPVTSSGQACCSGGTPLLGSLELPAAEQNLLRFSLNYDYNRIYSLMDGREVLEDEIRQRSTHSTILESTYGFSDRFSFTLMLTGVQQERRTFSQIGTELVESVRSRGLGDAIFLLKYNLEELKNGNQRIITLGIGPKVPIGSFNKRNSIGVLLPADLQPGTGAWDGIIWAYLYQGIKNDLSNIFATVSYRYTGSNQRFISSGSNLTYRFGNEFVFKMGSAFRRPGLFDYSFLGRLRNIRADLLSNEHIPNTGGTWISIEPALILKFNKATSARISGQLPIYRNVIGTQLTTTYKFSFTLIHNIYTNDSND